MNIRPRRQQTTNNNGWTTKINNPIFKFDNDFNNKFKDHDFAIALPADPQRSLSTPNDFRNYKKNQTKKSLPKKILNEMEAYCDKTTLHGLKYVGDTTLTIGERIFWFVAFASAIGFAAYYITNIYEKWNLNPVVITFSPYDVTMLQIPFPAITICNMNQAKRTEAEKILYNGTLKEQKLLEDYCNLDNSFDQFEDGPNWETVRSFLIKTGLTCGDMLKQCEWQGEKINCEDFFNNDLTDEGLCCSFNRLPPPLIFKNLKELEILNQTYPDNVLDWTPEIGYKDEQFSSDYVPRRASGSGTHLGLTIVLDAQIDNYYCSSTESAGFKILLYNPIETPKISDFGLLIGTGMESRIVIEPVIRDASKNLRSISIQNRQCYFSNERPLFYYRTYTKRNCKLECQANYTLDKCKCIPYFLPRNKLVKVCGRKEEACSNKAKMDMELVYGNGTSCNCLPGCSEVYYTQSITSSQLSKHLNRSHSWNPSLPSSYFTENIAVLHFFFRESSFRKTIKSEFYGFTEVLSNVGGLLGLCMGFSFLSFIEILYYLTIKICCNLLKSHKKQKFNGAQSIYPFLK